MLATCKQHSIRSTTPARTTNQRSSIVVFYYYYHSLLFGRPIIQIIPFPLAPTTTVLRFRLAVRIMVVFALNVAFGGAFGAHHRSGDSVFALVMGFSVVCVWLCVCVE